MLALLVDAAGRPLPQSLVDKLHRTCRFRFNQGFKQAELWATGIVDMNLHLDAKGVVDPVGLEQTLLAELGMPVQMVARHHGPTRPRLLWRRLCRRLLQRRLGCRAESRRLPCSRTARTLHDRTFTTAPTAASTAASTAAQVHTARVRQACASQAPAGPA